MTEREHNEIYGFKRSYINLKMPEYNSKFKTRVQDLTISCVYDYNTVYRLCSIFGFKKGKEYINTLSGEYINGLLNFVFDFPYAMDDIEEEAVRAKLRHIDPTLPEVFESLLESSEYNSETLYRVFMAHGCEAKEIIEYAGKAGLMPFQLLQYSDEKMRENTEETMKNMRLLNFKSNEDKLPRKLRAGWK